MVVLLTGATHTGKTVLAQRLLDAYHYPYLSIDHLKMGLIRSGHTSLTPADDRELTAFLWPIVSEIIKTAIENKQDLVVEGVYIPFDWRDSFDQVYLSQIYYICLVMSAEYINVRFADILRFASVIEDRRDDLCDKNELLKENAYMLEQCKRYGLPYILIENEYNIALPKLPMGKQTRY